MTRSRLFAGLGVVGCAVAAGLSAAGPPPGPEPRGTAPAAQPRANDRPFGPRLRVEQRPVVPGQAGEVVIDLTQRAGELALERASITAPNGFGLGPAAEGGPVAEVEAVVVDGGGERLLRGSLSELEAADGECGDGVETSLAATLRDGSSRAVGLVAGLKTAGASPVLTLCPSRERGGSLRRLTVRLPRAETPAGIRETLWRGRFFPAGAAARPAESRAVVPVPSFLTLEAVRGPQVRPGARVTVRGYLLQVDPQAGRNVRLVALSDAGPATLLGRTRTTPNGSYSVTFDAPRRPGALELVARAQSIERPCAATARGGCSPTVVSGVSSPALRLSVLD